MSGASEFGKDYGLIHEAVVTSRKAGWGQDEWARLAHNEARMVKVRDVLLGRSVVQSICPTIDARVPSALVESTASVKSHRRMGTIQWNWVAQADALWIDPGQSDYNLAPTGREMLEYVDDKPVLNACVLDFLLAHPEFVPEAWFQKTVLNPCIFFWGTIYSVPNWGTAVRFLHQDSSGKLKASFSNLSDPLRENCFTALLADV